MEFQSLECPDLVRHLCSEVFRERFSLEEEEEGLYMASFRARLRGYSDVYQKVSCSEGRGPSVA